MSSARQTAVWGAQLQQVNRRELEVQTHPILASSANQALWTKTNFSPIFGFIPSSYPKESEESGSASALWPYKGFYPPAEPASGFLKTGVGRSCKSLAMIEPKNGCCPGPAAVATFQCVRCWPRGGSRSAGPPATVVTQLLSGHHAPNVTKQAYGEKPSMR